MSGNTLFVTLVTAASKSTHIIFGDNKGHQFFSRVNKQCYVASFLSRKSATRIGYTQFSCDVLPRSTFELYNWANCLGQLLDVPSRENELPLLCKYSQSSAAKTRILFLELSVWLIRRKLELFPGVTLFPKIQFSNCLPDFAKYPERVTFLDTVES